MAYVLRRRWRDGLDHIEGIFKDLCKGLDYRATSEDDDVDFVHAEDDMGAFLHVDVSRIVVRQDGQTSDDDDEDDNGDD